MTFIEQWKIPLALWFASLLIFLALSAAIFVKGAETVHYIAVAFHENRAQDMLSHRNYHGAVKEYTAWSWLEPESQELINNIAEAHLLNKQPDQAFYRIVPIAEAMTTDDFDICRLMALIQSDRQDESAMDWARRAQASAYPDETLGGELILAHVNRRLGNSKQATDGYKRVLELNPDHPEAKYNLAREVDRNSQLVAIAHILKQPQDTFNPLGCTPEFVVKAANATPN